MNDRLYPLPLPELLRWALQEYKANQTIFGIHESLFFQPRSDGLFHLRRYGQLLETPIGVAAGPHTQLAQNIAAAWLCGARYIELKTVQTLDELEVTKPCIDMQDEGYNCEWSQELRLPQSLAEYLKAWLLIQALRRLLGWNKSPEPGFIFNLSVGYDYAGIQSPNVQAFLDGVAQARPHLEELQAQAAEIYPPLKEVALPESISDNVTLSTMHGCPPDEIEKIAAYLLTERRLHTTVKLNPTLLGPAEIQRLLYDELGYHDVEVPAEAFDHDLKYAEAVELITRLQELAQREGLAFGLKLTNTLEVVNTKGTLPEKEARVYLSGRALHPLSINLAARLQWDFQGELDISFSAGVDAFNLPEVLAAGLQPATVCSDLLKPGGYGRLSQYLEELEKAMRARGAQDLPSFVQAVAEETSMTHSQAALHNLENYARRVASLERYHRQPGPLPDIKTRRELTPFDCVAAPCMENCATGQEIPSYLYYTAQGEYGRAYETILHTNPLPAITGFACDRQCRLKCTRIHYDQALHIRAIKRFVMEQAAGNYHPTRKADNSRRAAVIGAGPAGMACAYYLAQAGWQVEVFEARQQVGGLPAAVIPHFRLPDSAVQIDVALLQDLGVTFHFGQKVDAARFQELRAEFPFIFLGVGAEDNRPLGLEGEQLPGVTAPLDFLARFKEGKSVSIGPRVLVIGGGNTAMDVVRTAVRILGKQGQVTLVYRRTRREMTADWEEIAAALAEGVEVIELAAPVAIQGEEKLERVVFQRMRLGAPGADGRPRPEPIPGETFTLPADTLIPAIGQQRQLSIPGLEIQPDGSTNLEGVYVGGDYIRGASSIIAAVADGRRAAERMLQAAGELLPTPEPRPTLRISLAGHYYRAARRDSGPVTDSHGGGNSLDFSLVEPGLTENTAQQEADRCLLCDEVCNVCVTVCPNRANLGYWTKPGRWPVYALASNGDQRQLVIKGYREFRQEPQVLNIADFCNECGNCTTFCPTAGEPYKDKPRFFLSEQAWREDNEGYWFDGRRLHYRRNDQNWSLERQGEGWQFAAPVGQGRLNPQGEVLEFQAQNAPADADDLLRPLTDMLFLFHNLEGHYFFEMNGGRRLGKGDGKGGK